MADFPQSIFNQRNLENRNGVSFDSSNSKVLYAEDLEFLADEIVSIESEFHNTLLTGVRYPRVVGSNLSIGFNSLYTVPTGKKAFVSSLKKHYNNSGGSITVYPFIRVSGIDYILGSSLTMASGAGASQDDGQGIILNAGESIGLNVAVNNGLNTFFNVIEFDDSVPLFRFSIFGLSSGDNLLYTCGGGSGARLFSDLYSPPVCAIYNGSIASVTYNYFNVRTGGTPSSLYKRRAGVAVANTTFYGEPWGDNFDLGDSIVINSSSGNAGQNAWVNVWEI